ncbi:MAG: ABC transporter permease, partial [Bacteroidaceae bacterium]
MIKSKANFSDFWNVAKREWHRLIKQPVYIYTLIGAPILVAVFFITLVHSGLPQNLPIGLIDMDNTPTSRSIARNLNTFEHSEIVANYPTILEAREAVQKGEIYGFFYIPSNFTKDATAMRRPTLSYYTNDSYILAGSGIFVDMKTMATLASGKVIQSNLSAKGYDEQQIAALLQPIIVDSHQINNPWASYAVYLCSDFVPGIFMLLFLLITVYTVLSEIKMKTSREWLLLSKRSIIVALSAKLFPQFIIECLILWGYDYTMYFILGFPCACGFPTMMFGGVLMILA